MRKIRFRAWDKKNKRMFYAGSLSGVSDFYTAIYNDKENPYEQFLIDYKWMQYTGFKDKCGRDIYEGDCLFESGEEGFLVKVFWNSDAGSWGVDITGNTEWLADYAEYSEVVGNIYEHPELLKEDKQE